MKTFFRSLLILGALALALLPLLFLTGCASLSGRPIVPQQTVHEFTITNTVPVVSIVTNEVPGLPPVVVTITNLVEDVRLITQTNTVYVVSTNWVNAIDTARAVNEIANPSPTAPLINLGLGAVVAALGWYARFKTNRARATEDLLKTVIDGVEQANNADVKKSIEREATLRGVNTALHSLVKNK